MVAVSLKVESAAAGADPKRTVCVRMERDHHITRKPFSRGEGSKLVVLEFAKATQGADPDVALRVFIDRADKVVGQPIGFRVYVETIVSQARKAAGRPDPN